MKIQYRKPRTTPDQQIRIVTDYNSGMPIKEIMERNHVTKRTLYNILKRQA